MKLKSLVTRDNVRADVTYGNDADDLDNWQKMSNPWTVTLKRGRRRLTTHYWTGSAITEDPTAADVLSSLLLDASCGDQSFEDFCGDFGYDTDSRKHFATWEQCRQTSEDLHRFLGERFDEYAQAEH